MKARTLWIVAMLLALAAPVTGSAQEENRFLAMSVADLAQVWLLRDCGTLDEPLLEAAVLQHAEGLRPLFSRAWEEGPPEESFKGVREDARSRFDRNRAALEDAGSLGLTSEDAKRAGSRTVDDFVKRAVDSFETGYRSQALRGLYFVGGDEGRQLLEQIAGEEDSPFGDAARILLGRAKRQSRP